MDLLRWIDSTPTEVYAHANHKILTDWPVDDTSIAIYQFPNSVIRKVFVSIGYRRDYTMRTVLYGTKGTIICDNTSDTMKLYEDDVDGKDCTKAVPCLSAPWKALPPWPSAPPVWNLPGSISPS